MPTVIDLGEPAYWHSIQLQSIARRWIGLAGRLSCSHKAGESLQGWTGRLLPRSSVNICIRCGKSELGYTTAQGYCKGEARTHMPRLEPADYYRKVAMPCSSSLRISL